MHFQTAVVADTISGGTVEHSLAAFTRLSRRLLDRAFYARVRAYQNREARFNGLMSEASAGRETF